MIGFYVNKLGEKTLSSLLQVDLDFVWLHGGHEQEIRRLRDRGLKIYYPIGIFVAQNEKEKKEYAAIDKNGNKVREFAGWYVGLCPTKISLRNKRLRELEKVFKSGLYDGVYLDSIRYPTYWETKKSEYLGTCYCEECEQKFSHVRENGIRWEEFRIGQIESFIDEVANIKKDKKLGYFAVPESKENLNTIFAQPYRIFKDKVDYVSPMIYPQMVGKDMGWVRETIKRFQKEFGRERTIPIAQVVKMPEDSEDKFSKTDALNLAKEISSLGHIGFFMLDQIADNSEFIERLVRETQSEN